LDAIALGEILSDFLMGADALETLWVIGNRAAVFAPDGEAVGVRIYPGDCGIASSFEILAAPVVVDDIAFPVLRGPLSIGSGEFRAWNQCREKLVVWGDLAAVLEFDADTRSEAGPLFPLERKGKR
jgi:hypothetical protein